jgi:glycine/D-amino acid oxidase-like deaminating enzyme
LERAEVLGVEPGVDPAILRGLWTEGNGKVDPPSYTRAAIASALKLGARLQTGEVRGLKRSNGRVTGVLLDSGSMSCDAVVIATGPWSAQPAQWLGTPIPVEPIKGELLLTQPDDPGVECDFAWRDAAVYRRRNGEVWLGGNEERAGFDQAPTRTGRELILQRVSRVFPKMKEVRVHRQIAALRPVTPDGFPILGFAPGWENVCLAMGAGRKGMLLGAGMGKAAAELITLGSTRLPIDACSPERWVAAPIS